ncbi:MAG: GDSL-type esterase/lipase family protein [Saprospiraceae bacterium]|nr:GDSL-type esterase/lipase family protein [Saprospiraceae bacterium]
MSQIRIACMGDSLTEGYGIDLSQRWTDLLAADIGIEVFNSGISGDTTAGMLARFKPMVIDLNPTHCIIMGGTNDVSHGLPIEIIISNIRAMTRYARHYGIQSIIGIPTPVLIDEADWGAMYPAMRAFAGQLEVYLERLRQFAVEDDQPVIEFGKGLGAEHFLPDGVHPNEAGHAQMAQNAVEVVGRLMKD